MALAVSLSAAGTSVVHVPPSITGAYGNTRAMLTTDHRMELFLVRSPSGYSAILQCWDPEPGYPAVVEASVDDGSLHLDVPTDTFSKCPAGTYSGTFEVPGLQVSGVRLHLQGSDDWPGYLSRGKSAWQ